MIYKNKLSKAENAITRRAKGRRAGEKIAPERSAKIFRRIRFARRSLTILKQNFKQVS